MIENVRHQATGIIGLRKRRMLEDAGITVVDMLKLAALERLYKALHDKKVCEAKFDQCGDEGDAEGQTVVIEYVMHFDEQVDDALAELEAMGE